MEFSEFFPKTDLVGAGSFWEYPIRIPRRGIRMGYSQKLPAPTKSVLGKNSENSIQGYDQELTSKSYNLGLYIPFGTQATLALYEERFLTTGGEDSGQVVSGGSLRLRGYPAGRWSDR